MSDTAIAILIAAAVVIVVAVVVIALLVGARRRRTERLHDRFGPEYDRVVGPADGRRERRSAEEELADRVERHDRLDLHPLGSGARERYLTSWRDTQAMFVDAPAPALSSPSPCCSRSCGRAAIRWRTSRRTRHLFQSITRSWSRTIARPTSFATASARTGPIPRQCAMRC